MFDLFPKNTPPSPTLLAVLCYAVWGFAPLVYLPMAAFGAEPLEIMAHRSIWAVLCAGLLCGVTRQFPEVLSLFRDPKLRIQLLITSLLVVLNWGVFVWAVTNAHTIETSLGYYLNPLLNMAAGAWLFKERLDRFGKAAIGCAAVGVVIQGIAIGSIPYVALILAVSFATYGIMRKQMAVNALPGLFVECAYLLIPALGYFIWFEATGQGHFFQNANNSFWLVMAGPITVIPLALFSYVARRMALSTMGFIQFIAPTISFIIGVSLGEHFNLLRGVSFAFIWGGAAIFAFGAYRRYRMLKEII